MRTLAAFAALAGLASAAAIAQTPRSTETREHTATIAAIDHTARTLSLKGDNGTVKMGVGPEVKRFGELKVGDQITFRYQESLLARISKPGRKAPGVPP